ncbi:MAG: zinc ribbon domain-containing protein [Planctomycetia bacterium]
MDPEPPAPAGTEQAPAAPLAGWVSCPRCSRRGRKGQPFCEHCGQRLYVEEAAPEARQRVPCTQCGATVAFPAGQRTATCPFCDTPYVGTGEVSAQRLEPEFVLPFSVAEAAARAAFQAWIGAGGPFVPGDLRQKARLDAPRGVYLPFWSFSARSDSSYTARVGEHWWETVVTTSVVNGRTVTRTQRVRRTEWYPFGGRFHQFHAHYLVSGSRGLPQGEADAIKPWPVSDVLRYQPQYLSGWMAEEYTIGRDEAQATSMQAFKQREREAVAAHLPGDTGEVTALETSFSEVTDDLLYLPVWLLAYTYGGRTYRYVINGATGRAHGTRPRSVPRMLAAAAGVLLLIVLVAWLASR